MSNTGELRRFIDALRGLFDIRTVMEWLKKPNPALGGLSPIDLIDRGDADRISRIVFELKAGTHV